MWIQSSACPGQEPELCFTQSSLKVFPEKEGTITGLCMVCDLPGPAQWEQDDLHGEIMES